jgi:uncharacterized protein
MKYETDPILSPGRRITIESREYKIEEFRGSGLSGQVYRATSGHGTYALKIFLPFYVVASKGYADASRTISELMEMQKAEFEFLSRLSHPNIVKVYGAHTLELSPDEVSEAARQKIRDVETVPLLVLDYVDGPTLTGALTDNLLNDDSIANILRRIAKALHYLHTTRESIHTDLKSTNIMIRRVDLEPVIVDFALCKNLNFTEVDRNESIVLGGAWYLVPEHISEITELKLLPGKPRELIKERIFPHLDYFQIGKMLDPNGAGLEIQNALKADAARNYIALVSQKLTDWTTVKDISPDRFLELFDKLDSGRFAVFGSWELNEPSSSDRAAYLSDRSSVPLAGWVYDLIETPSWQRLTTINQLSMLGVVYPGAGYSRSVHVLKSFDLARALLVRLHNNPYFRYLFTHKSIQQCLAATLLHDINHFPFLHIFQESRVTDNQRTLDFFCDGNATGERAAAQKSVYDLVESLDIDRDRLRTLLFGDFSAQKREEDNVIKSIIDSGVDVDKLSYLILDSHFCGVPYGDGIDVQCILNASTLVHVGREKRPHLAFDDNAYQAIESVMMTRFWNFRSMYWHHTNRALMAMLLRIVRLLITRGRLDFEDYLRETLWCGDLAALKFLSDRYEAALKKPSPLTPVLRGQRAKIYKRLHRLETTGVGARDNKLYDLLKGFNVDEELLIAKKLAEKLGSLLGLSADVDDVLLDVPRRDLDSGGAVYLRGDDAGPELMNELSPVLSQLSGNYQRLAKAARIFVSPKIHEALRDRFGDAYRNTEESRWNDLLRKAQTEVKAESEVL